MFQNTKNTRVTMYICMWYSTKNLAVSLPSGHRARWKTTVTTICLWRKAMTAEKHGPNLNSFVVLPLSLATRTSKQAGDSLLCQNQEEFIFFTTVKQILLMWTVSLQALSAVCTPMTAVIAGVICVMFLSAKRPMILMNSIRVILFTNCP